MCNIIIPDLVSLNQYCLFMLYFKQDLFKLDSALIDFEKQSILLNSSQFNAF